MIGTTVWLRVPLACLLAPWALAASLGDTLVWPSGSEFGALEEPTRTLLGQFSEGLANDLIILRGQQPVLVIEPGHQTSFNSWPVVANDFDRLPGGLGEVDHLISIGPAGLQESWLGPGGVVTVETIDGDPIGVWSDGVAVRVGKVNDDEHYDIVGIDLSGHWIQSKLWDEASGSWADGPYLSISSAAMSLELLDWSDLDPRDELAINTCTGFEVYAFGQGPAPIAFLPTPTCGANSMARFPMFPPGTKDGLATLSPSSTGNPTMAVIYDGGAEGMKLLDDPQVVFDSTAIGLRTADVNEDGRTDIGYANAVGKWTRVYLGGTQSLDPFFHSQAKWSRKLPSGAHLAQPAYAEFYGNECADSAYPSLDNLRLHDGPIYFGSAPVSFAAKPSVSNVSLLCAPEARVQFQLAYPNLPSNHSSDWELRFVVWTRENLDTSGLDGGAKWWSAPAPPGNLFDVQLPLADVSDVFSDQRIHYVEIQARRVSPQGAVLAVQRRFQFAVWIAGYAESDWDGEPIVQGSLQTEILGDGCSQTLGGPVSGYVEVGRLPIVPPGVLPLPPSAGGSSSYFTVTAP